MGNSNRIVDISTRTKENEILNSLISQPSPKIMGGKTFLIIVFSCLASSKVFKGGQDVRTQCSSIHPCDVNQGQCSVNSDCKRNLICGQCQELDLTSASKCCKEQETNALLNSSKCKDKKPPK